MTTAAHSWHQMLPGIHFLRHSLLLSRLPLQAFQHAAISLLAWHQQAFKGRRAGLHSRLHTGAGNCQQRPLHTLVLDHPRQVGTGR
jgi:hypothetical protein